MCILKKREVTSEESTQREKLGDDKVIIRNGLGLENQMKSKQREQNYFVNEQQESTTLYDLFKELMGREIRNDDELKIVSRELLETMHFLLAHDYQQREQKEYAYKKERQAIRPIGRPKLSQEAIATVKFYREQRKMSYREIANETGVSLGAIYKYCNENKDGE